MKMNRRSFAATTLATVAAAPWYRAAAQATPNATPVPSSLEQKIQDILANGGVPGALVAIHQKDTTNIMEFGLADVGTNEPIRADMHMRIASITKTFVATMVLQLVDEGKIALDEPVATYLPSLEIVNTNLVTIRHLLGMQSGLPHIEHAPAWLDAIVADSTREFSLEESYSYVKDLPALAEPGTVLDYNNLNYNILGDVIEAVTGSDWDANLQTRITEPLDLANTFLPTTADMPNPASRGYGYPEQDISHLMATPEVAELMQATPVISATPIADHTPLNDAGLYDLTLFHPSIAGAAGGLVSTIGDMIVWARAYGSGKLISPEMFEQQTTMTAMDPSGMVSYGLGMIGVQGLLFGHNGAINGYQSLVSHLPRFDLDIAVLSNCYPPLGYGDIGFEIASVILGA